MSIHAYVPTFVRYNAYLVTVEQFREWACKNAKEYVVRNYDTKQIQSMSHATYA